jgi:hypothetical protein
MSNGSAVTGQPSVVQPFAMNPGAVKQGNGLAVAALTLGIIGSVVGLIPLFFFIAVPLGLLAIIFGGVGLAKSGRAGRRGMSIAGLVLGLLALVLGIVGVAIVDDAVDDLEEAFAPAAADDYELEMTSCGTGEFGRVSATGTITNTSGEQEGFMITVEFLDADGVRVAEGLDFVSDLAAGKSATWEAIDFEDVSGTLTCQVTVE